MAEGFRTVDLAVVLISPVDNPFNVVLQVHRLEYPDGEIQMIQEK